MIVRPSWYSSVCKTLSSSLCPIWTYHIPFEYSNLADSWKNTLVPSINTDRHTACIWAYSLPQCVTNSPPCTNLEAFTLWQCFLLWKWKCVTNSPHSSVSLILPPAQTCWRLSQPQSRFPPAGFSGNWLHKWAALIWKLTRGNTC